MMRHLLAKAEGAAISQHRRGRTCAYCGLQHVRRWTRSNRFIPRAVVIEAEMARFLGRCFFSFCLIFNRIGYCEFPIIEEHHLFNRQVAVVLHIQSLEYTPHILTIEAIRSARSLEFAVSHFIGTIIIEDCKSSSDTAKLFVSPRFEITQRPTRCWIDFSKTNISRQIIIESAPSPCDITFKAHLFTRLDELAPITTIASIQVQTMPPSFQKVLVRFQQQRLQLVRSVRVWLFSQESWWPPSI
mmetsp:Transcript_122620/g.192410  ORF Transcript_122620/g.192410 Transcript_122620/m.192410 type:complete len:243 (-) Transcript_122620:1260-1988(-)